MKASELIVKCLANEGVGYVFGIPGEENMDGWTLYRRHYVCHAGRWH
jgi:thiamine pyrophosphate-dependent acetolactate synthase large subunit-like protein